MIAALLLAAQLVVAQGSCPPGQLMVGAIGTVPGGVAQCMPDTSHALGGLSSMVVGTDGIRCFEGAGPSMHEVPCPGSLDAKAANIDRAHAICERHYWPGAQDIWGNSMPDFYTDGWKASCKVIKAEWDKHATERSQAQQAQDRADQEFVDRIAKTLEVKP